MSHKALRWTTVIVLGRRVGMRVVGCERTMRRGGLGSMGSVGPRRSVCTMGLHYFKDSGDEARLRPVS